MWVLYCWLSWICCVVCKCFILNKNMSAYISLFSFLFLLSVFTHTVYWIIIFGPYCLSFIVLLFPHWKWDHFALSHIKAYLHYFFSFINSSHGNTQEVYTAGGTTPCKFRLFTVTGACPTKTPFYSSNKFSWWGFRWLSGQRLLSLRVNIFWRPAPQFWCFMRIQSFSNETGLKQNRLQYNVLTPCFSVRCISSCCLHPKSV